MEALSKIKASLAEHRRSNELLSGWGHFQRALCSTELPDTIGALKSSLADSNGKHVLARGLGRSYGDAAISASSRIIKTEKLNRFLEFNSESGLLKCQPGVTFEELLDTFLFAGWFPPVTPGTKHVTMGGAFAADIHGKNHHIDGSFSDFVESIIVLDAAGKPLRCSRFENADLFWASAGGMGLTGVVSELQLKLLPVETAFIKVRKIRCANLQETFDAIETYEKEYHYSVSWIDALASGGASGRSILNLGTHAKISDLDAQAKVTVFQNPVVKEIPVPMDLPGWVLNRRTISAFNQLYYSLTNDEERLSHFEPYFYPLDFLSDWYRLYGRAGFIQYQCALPQENSRQGLEEILSLSSRSGRSSFLAVLKKFGAGHQFLSFPIPGYTLTLDLPVKSGLFEFTKQLDELVIKYGGRVYLAKDACVSADDFRAMYEGRVDDWLRVKREVDPRGRFRSQLAERLALV